MYFDLWQYDSAIDVIFLSVPSASVITLGLYLCSSFVHQSFKVLITFTLLMIIATAVRISHNRINVIIENVPASTGKGLTVNQSSVISITTINKHPFPSQMISSSEEIGNSYANRHKRFEGERKRFAFRL